MLTRPDRLFKFLNALTSSITVDEGISSIPKLTGLAKRAKAVPDSKIRFITMPTGAAPTDPNRVVKTADADTIFASIAKDREVPVESNDTETSTAPKTPVKVLNAAGTQGLATSGQTALTNEGYVVSGVETAQKNSARTRIFVDSTPEALKTAKALNKKFGFKADIVEQPSGMTGVWLIVGTDRVNAGFEPATPDAVKATTRTASDSSAAALRSAGQVAVIDHLDAAVDRRPRRPTPGRRSPPRRCRRSSVRACAATRMISSQSAPSGTLMVCTCGVSMPPGHTQFTRSGVLRYSTASALVSPTMPCLAAVYAAEYASPITPATEATLTMLPPVSSRCGIAAWAEEERAAEVQRDVGVPLLLGDVGGHPEVVPPGVVDQHVEAAVRVDSGSDRGPAVGSRRDVEGPNRTSPGRSAQDAATSASFAWSREAA